MAIAGIFNDVGVKRSGVSSRDVMLVYGAGYDVGYKSGRDEAFQQSLAQSVPSPVFGDNSNSNSDTFLQDLAGRRDNSSTLMETLRSDRDYKPPKIDARSLMRDPNKAIRDGGTVSQKASGGMEAVQSQKALFKADFMQAKAEATQMLKDSAKSMGIDSGDAVNQMMAKKEMSNIGVLANTGMSAIGGPLVAVGVTVGSIKQELSKKDKMLSPKQQKALLEDTLKRLQESRKLMDSREEAFSGKKMDSELDKEIPTQSEFAWEDMKAEDLAALMISDPEGKDQPEMEELMQAECELDAVQRNHDYVQEHYADNVTVDKMTVAAEANGAVAGLIADAQVIEPSLDSGDVYIAGESIKGIVVASDTELDSKSVKTVMNWNMLDVEAVKEQLNSGIGFSA